jgi:hypothetical protein
MELGGLGHLNHDPHGLLVHQNRPHCKGPEDRMQIGSLLLCVAFGFAGAEDAVEQSQGLILLRKDEGWRRMVVQADGRRVDP